ncbi:MAG: dipeptidyl peptidase 3 [Cyclobacteriaceae bacterium]|nr:dipeptidyl peptidase 3 [Cyclobacteriaceae bacterium]
MELLKRNYWILLIAVLAFSCTSQQDEKIVDVEPSEDFEYFSEQFADLKIIRYKIPGFDRLTAKQKELVYYLTQAGLEGRDIMWDQNYRHNLVIRKALENIVRTYEGDKESEDWKNFMVYIKRIWFSNGIHHHYSNDKIMPEFSKEYFQEILSLTNTSLDQQVVDVLFDAKKDAKKVNLDPKKGLLLGSAINFYDPDITEAEVDAFYAAKMDANDEEPLSYGLNSKIVRTEDGSLKEEVYKVGGLYGAAIEKIIGWLEKASGVAENEKQQKAFNLLIEYYKTGSLETWDEYNIAWVEATEGDIDYINSFIEVYNDPKGYRGSYENIVEINDFEASARMKVLADNVQWFEDNSSIMDEHKKDSVVGVSYKVVNVAGEAGDASPATPIGVNLPNANWIRAKHGSKSVSLGNILDAYGKAGSSGFLEEFAFDEAEIKRSKEFSEIGDNMHTALHEVVGHASGQLNSGVGTPKETLKSYASALEEGRADLVALYFLMDEKLVELGLIPSLEVGKEEYDGYIRNGLMLQLRRLEKGADIEEAHMRNRQMIAKWAYEKGKPDNVIERKERDGKTYFVVNDYEKLQSLFGELLREIQRIKSEGDYEAGKNLIENYGVKVDQKLHAEVLERAEKLKSAPYGGFINPVLVPVMDDNGNITDVTIEYPTDFTKQMLYYSEKYGNL